MTPAEKRNQRTSTIGRFWTFVLILVGLCEVASANSVRIRDLVEFDGVRGNDLVGYGLVVGLNGTGDGFRNSPFTEEALTSLLERLGVNVAGEDFKPKNVAAVLVTATLPPFSRAGGKIDVNVSAIGDAKSLRGGTLVMTPLNAADGEIYAVAQGGLIAGGITGEGDAESITQGVPTAGVIPSGARIEREIAFALGDLKHMRLALRDADFTTALRIETAINAQVGEPIATMLDSGTVQLRINHEPGLSPARMLAMIENIQVEPQQKARVVVDQRSGTIVLGQSVQISQVAVTKGAITVRVSEQAIVSQPNPFADGETIIVPRSLVDIEEDEAAGFVEIAEATTLPEVVDGLNALGVSSGDVIDILKSIKAAGALHAEFIVQ